MNAASQQLSNYRFSSRFQMTDRPSIKYKSHFKKWDESSWARSKPHRKDPFNSDLYFYSEPLASLFIHPDVKNAPEEIRRKLLILHLYNYLEFTIRLELGPVNEVSKLLTTPDFLNWLPPQMKDDALRIYVDEGGHAQMSRELMQDVEQFTEVRRPKIYPEFLNKLDDLVGREEPEYQSIIKLFFVIISETLITGTLINLPKDETVQQSVRELAMDHALDEAKHHTYFRQVFQYVWHRLPREMKRKIGSLLPDMILAFLEPDKLTLTLILEQFPSNFPMPIQIVEEVLASELTKEGIIASATPTLKMLKENNVFDEPEIADIFRPYNLVLT